MNSIWGAELNYAPDYWPLWLIYAGVVVVLMIAGLVTHALLRRMLAPKTTAGEEHRDYLYSLAVRRWHWGNALLFILLLLSGLFGHFSVGPVALMVQIHTWCGFALLAFWIGFVLINATSGNGCHYRGDSRVINPQGEIIATADAHQATRIDAELSMAALREYREKFPAWQDADEFRLW